ncbi:MAG TPA: transposase [Bacteroidota bacterium]|nr:transposase [Bacteroidota bacterium]
MRYDPKKHHRTSIRLPGYDYSSEGSYFVTGVTRNRECALGVVKEDAVVLSEAGEIVRRCWLALPDAFPNLGLDEFQIMPDHFHGIVVLWKDRPRRDLINQITTKEDTTTEDQTETDDSEIPTGIDPNGFGSQLNWPLMKNPKMVLGKILRHFKAKATKEIHDRCDPGFGWQGRFHDHIIRDGEDLERVRVYIRNNPLNWWLDPRKRRKAR